MARILKGFSPAHPSSIR